MEDKDLIMLARMVLPTEVLDNFVITDIEYIDTKAYDEPEIHFHLDEKMHPDLQRDVHFESKGFIAPVEVTDFPIRDHKVVLVLRRRRWVDIRTGKSFILPLKVTADGTRYSKEFAAFLKETYGDIPGDLPTLEDFYHIDAHTFEKQYKEVQSGYRTWSELSHADEWLVFPDNIGPNLATDETSLSNGELYTIVTNRDRHGGERCLVAVVLGTKSEDVIKALERIPEERRETVTEITLDLSDSMRRIVRSAFPKAQRVIDRFHIQKLACDAVQEMRIRHRWDAIQEANDDMENAKLEGREYIPLRYQNGETKKELQARSRFLLFKSADKWTDSQKRRARILFGLYPDLQKAYSLCHSLRMIFAKNTIKDAAKLSMARWYNKVEEAGFHSFSVIAAMFYEHYEDILNFYNYRASNAAAESFNAKVKAFRAALRGVRDEKFFIYRLSTIYAYPH